MAKPTRKQPPMCPDCHVRMVKSTYYSCPKCGIVHNPTQKPGLYQAFHGNPPTTRKVDLPVPRPGQKLVAIGRLEAVTYAPYGNSELAGRFFEHKSGDTGTKILKDKPILATDGTNLFIIPDKAKMRFTSRGIIG